MSIMHELECLPDEIREQRIKVWGLSEKMDEMKRSIKTWELTQMAKISDEVDKKGKAIFSNDTRRQAELEKRKQESTEYQELSNNLKALKNELDLAVIDLHYYNDKQDNSRALTILMEGGK